MLPYYCQPSPLELTNKVTNLHFGNLEGALNTEHINSFMSKSDKVDFGTIFPFARVIYAHQVSRYGKQMYAWQIKQSKVPDM